MFATRVMAAAILGGLVLGCQQPPKTPPPSSLAAADARELTQRAATYRNAHPGSEVGVVNAVLPDRRIVSIDGLPLDRIKTGDVVTLLGGNGKTPIEAVVYAARSGYAQVRYQPLPAGQLDPMAGDMAVWYPVNAGTPMSPTNSIGELRRLPASAPMEMPATMPASIDVKDNSGDAIKRYIATPATTVPAAPGDSTSPATAPASRPVVDFNK